VSKESGNAAQTVVRSLKSPLGVPTIRDVYTNPTNAKIAESIAMIGNRGAYFIGLTDLSVEVRNIILSFLSAAATFLEKLPEIISADPAAEKAMQDATLVQAFETMVGALADMEVNTCIAYFQITQIE
jgi:hypothetical protein